MDKNKNWQNIIIITISCIVIAITGFFVYSATGITIEDVIKDSKTVWLDSKTVCQYRTICNPTSTNFKINLKNNRKILSGLINDNSILQIETSISIPYITENCVSTKNNQSYECKNVTNYNYEKVWTSLDNFTYSANTCYSTRQCATRNNNLDYFEIDLNLGSITIGNQVFDLSHYTVISSSGYNETYVNISRNNLYFSFDTNNITGNTIIDISKNTNATNFGSTTGIIGKINTSIDSNAGKGFLSMTQTLSGKSNVSICGWINYTAGNDANYRQLFESGTGSTNSAIQMYKTNSDGFFNCGIWGIGTTNAKKLLNDGTRHFVCCTYRTGTNVTLYSDGSLIGSDAMTYTVGSGGQRIFSRYNANSTNWLGGLDEFSIWNITGYSESENLAIHTKLYNSGSGFNPYYSSTVYNSTYQFYNVNITSNCNNTLYINISRDNIVFEPISNYDYHVFSELGTGFYLRVDTTKCSWTFLSVLNPCGCSVGSNWFMNSNCTLSSDCDIRPYNFSCKSGQIFNITNGALLRFNSTPSQGLNCSIYIKDTGLLSG